jgi:hypothetical protein
MQQMRKKRTSPPENGDPPENGKKSGIAARPREKSRSAARKREPSKNVKAFRKNGKKQERPENEENGKEPENGEGGERPENGQPANVKVCRNQAKNKIFPKTGKLPENGKFLVR